ncbi:methylated-DNA-[protein]-cysteine S-methyltransferase [Mesorhizobium sp. J18]|uniref:methylated-DNA--[protein]-cysteine S-methyltransferase n=1 Tax=Mesorhizobium sp. J18 TaxID=935263 RepID=UPI00119C03EA|nr:methylated-DNA--[protein]-cysteine S-methyltransferase [Mesorhizobium sp. J18]TWG96894.1 methylated-DNA-[protein]-cysteine S-methyltransferase [Mesorhizobium sp. J18]
MNVKSSPIEYMLVDTAIGPIGIAWNAVGLVRVQLPERDAEKTEKALTARLGHVIRHDEATSPLPPMIASLVGLLRRYAEGEAVDFSAVPVDFDGVDPFRKAIYRTARKLGFGETTTYGALAAEAGFPNAARDTGTALGRNPVPIVVPCHRILAAGGKLGGFSAPGGTTTKQKLLMMENARTDPPDSPQGSFAF